MCYILNYHSIKLRHLILKAEVVAPEKNVSRSLDLHFQPVVPIYLIELNLYPLITGIGGLPKTIKVTQDNPRFEDVEKEIGFPCWIRATEGTGGLALAQGEYAFEPVECSEMLIYKILIVKMDFIVCRRFTLGPCKSCALAKLPAERCFACAVLPIEEIDVGTIT